MLFGQLLGICRSHDFVAIPKEVDPSVQPIIYLINIACQFFTPATMVFICGNISNNCQPLHSRVIESFICHIPTKANIYQINDLLREPYKNRAFKFLSYLANITTSPKLHIYWEYHRLSETTDIRDITTFSQQQIMPICWRYIRF